MATCSNKLDLTSIDDRVVTLYQKLMTASSGKDSLYIKAKETLNAILDEAGITGREKSEVLASTVTGIVSGLSAQTLQAAIDLAKDERDAEYILAKLCADTAFTEAQKDKIVADTADTEANTNLKIANGWLIQAQLHRDYGVVPSNLTSYSKEMLINNDYDEDYGTKWENIRLTQANINSTYAGSFRQNGLVNIQTTAAGYLDTDAVTGTSGITTEGKEGLTYWQTRVAERQEQGFEDNKRQHVANSSATMISMLLSTEEADLVDDAAAALADWTTAIDYLNADYTG
jgi:hypothetical protein